MSSWYRSATTERLTLSEGVSAPPCATAVERPSIKGLQSLLPHGPRVVCSSGAVTWTFPGSRVAMKAGLRFAATEDEHRFEARGITTCRIAVSSNSARRNTGRCH